jgi:hypothetical protein
LARKSRTAISVRRRWLHDIPLAGIVGVLCPKYLGVLHRGSTAILRDYLRGRGSAHTGCHPVPNGMCSCNRKRGIVKEGGVVLVHIAVVIAIIVLMALAYYGSSTSKEK